MLYFYFLVKIADIYNNIQKSVSKISERANKLYLLDQTHETKIFSHLQVLEGDNYNENDNKYKSDKNGQKFYVNEKKTVKIDRNGQKISIDDNKLIKNDEKSGINDNNMNKIAKNGKTSIFEDVNKNNDEKKSNKISEEEKIYVIYCQYAIEFMLHDRLKADFAISMICITFFLLYSF